MNYKKQKRNGFTLIELMVAMAIVILLSAATFFGYGQVQEMRRKAQASAELSAMASACAVFESLHINGAIPNDLKELENGITADDAIDDMQHKELIKSERKDLSKDPWGGTYIYNKDSRTIQCQHGEVIISKSF
jgi:prepilin-type N-terminal cleavage/methylation domain-containing protein